jgi:UDP-N-acetylmuramate--alanine ligase
MEHFWSSFNDSDYLIINDIFPAGEEPIEGIHSREIVDGVRKFGHKNAKYLATAKETLKRLSQILQPGDVFMTLGAGNVWELGRDLLANLPEQLREGKSGKDS